MTERSSDMTLAFTLPALRRLEDPAAAFEDAREWTAYVGVVSEDVNGGLNYTRTRRIRTDFFSGTRSVADTLVAAGSTYDTERHVLVGTDAADREVASRFGWEYRPVEEAAERAGWALETEDGDDGGLLARLWPL